MLRIGKINFANLYPIFYTLEREGDPALYRFVEGVPSEINRLLREGAVDISPSSSIEYLRREDRYDLIDGHSVSSFGEIQSILLFSRYPIEKLRDKTVLASSQSETSTALLRIILRRFMRIGADVSVSSLDLQSGLGVSDAYMLIGDDALSWGARAERIGDSRILLPLPNGSRIDLFLYDLGSLWYERTGLPFVFALWIARRECCTGGEVSAFSTLLNRARNNALGHFREIAGGSPYAEMLGVEGLVSYWKLISYNFDESHRKGLELFRKYLEHEDLL